MRTIILCALALLITLPAHGKPHCETPEKQFKTDERPYPGEEEIANTNNLRRKTGSAIYATGDRIYFNGRITDENCVPISNAIVEIWHADNTGKYSYQIKWEDISNDEYFIGTGRYKTDNNGEFSFLTIFPGFYDNRAPHINIRVSHPDFEPYVGEVFFARHPLNRKDPHFKHFARKNTLPPIAEEVPLGDDEIYTDRTFYTEIALEGQSTFRRY